MALFAAGVIWAKRAKSGATVAKRTAGGWLFKEEPNHYSFDDLERDRNTIWDGVDNNLARMHLRSISVGDLVLFYYSGAVKAIVGEMVVTEGPMPDPSRDDPKAVVVSVKAVSRWKSPVSLARIKQEPSLCSWELVKNSRLSVMPVSADQWRKIKELRDAK
jgi:predicted RNA-binding protein with PUA-like domain